MPTLMLLSRAFSLNDFFLFPIADETKPSFQATITPPLCGVFSIAIVGFVLGCSRIVAVDIKVVAGRVGWSEKGGFFIGRGRAPLSPDPIPYSFRDGEFLQHAMY